MIIALSTGALFGDVAGSFIKRRYGIPTGKKTIPLDQLDFLIFSLIFAGFFVSIETSIILVLLVLTPPIHLLTNFIGYSIKLKKKPW
jgi:CDP-2,3-bis-(O-geranylgeranyl)-sn-glycerol synthase